VTRWEFVYEGERNEQESNEDGSRSNRCREQEYSKMKSHRKHKETVLGDPNARDCEHEATKYFQDPSRFSTPFRTFASCSVRTETSNLHPSLLVRRSDERFPRGLALEGAQVRSLHRPHLRHLDLQPSEPKDDVENGSNRRVPRS